MQKYEEVVDAADRSIIIIITIHHPVSSMKDDYCDDNNDHLDDSHDVYLQ